MQNDPLPPSPALPSAVPRIAVWWHTAAFLVLLAAWAALSGTRTEAYQHAPHSLTYISQMLMTWMLLGTVVAGITHRAAFFNATLRHAAQPLRVDLARGTGIYIGFYACAIAVLAIIVVLSGTGFRSMHPAPAAETDTQSSSAAPLPPPAPAAPPAARSRFGFNTRTIRALAPTSPLDLLLWLGVSFTAAFCEEHVFRGYLLTQARALLHGAGASTALANTTAVVATSLIFGSLHLYEGPGGACIIAALGAAYAICTLKFGNLRAVIVAHFLQDFVAGVFFYFRHGSHMH